MTSFAALGLLAILIAHPAHGHRDQESTSSSSKLEVNAGEQEDASRNSLEHLLNHLEGECKTDRDSYEASDTGIEALRGCVRALEAYANKVRDHQKESYKAHGRYRRAFIQTYSLLKSVLGEDNNIDRFKKTFESNHTNAAKYLQSQLDEIKGTVDKIGQRWGGESSSLLEASVDGHVIRHADNAAPPSPSVQAPPA